MPPDTAVFVNIDIFYPTASCVAYARLQHMFTVDLKVIQTLSTLSAHILNLKVM
jgi:hypothetical protein